MRWICRILGHRPTTITYVPLDEWVTQTLCRRCGDILTAGRSPGPVIFGIAALRGWFAIRPRWWRFVWLLWYCDRHDSYHPRLTHFGRHM